MATGTVLAVCAVVLLLAVAGAHLVSRDRFDRWVVRIMSTVSEDGADSGGLLASPVPAMDGLPDLVQRFLANSRVPASANATSVHLRQEAEMRMAPDKPWRPLLCEQVIAIEQPGFVWHAALRVGPVSLVRVVDAFVRGHGFLQARLFGSIPVGKMSGSEADRSELMRYLAEIAWAPDAALRNSALRWRSLGRNMLELEADSRGGVARVQLIFDERGDVVEMQAEERGSTEGGVLVPRPWRGYFSEHGDLGGRRIPLRGEVGYVYDDGYSAYWRGRIVDYQVS